MLNPHVLVLVDLLALTTRALSLLALHLVHTELHPLHDAVSLYAATRYGVLYQVQAIAGGVCALSLAGALILLRAPLPRFGHAALSVNGLAGLLIVAVPAKLSDKGAPLTRRVAVHLALAVVAFTAIALATGVLTAPIQAWSAWHGPARLLIVAGIWTPASVVFTFVTLNRARWRPYLGIFQRAIYLGIVCWLGALLVPLAR